MKRALKDYMKERQKKANMENIHDYLEERLGDFVDVNIGDVSSSAQIIEIAAEDANPQCGLGFNYIEVKVRIESPINPPTTKRYNIYGMEIVDYEQD